MKKSIELEITRINQGEKTVLYDQVISEYPLTIYLNDQEYATLLCTPENLESLIYGYLKTDLMIPIKEDIHTLIIDEDKGLAYVELDPKLIENLDFKSRYITSGCASSAVYYNTLDAIKLKSDLSAEPTEVSMQHLLQMMQSLNKYSELFKETGGVHVAGLCDLEKPVIFIEDIGRHNAVDKIIGYMLLNDISSSDKVMLVTGRISSEIVLKCAKNHINIIVSKSAATDKAIRIAKDLNIVLVGFARGMRGNIYSGERFILL